MKCDSGIELKDSTEDLIASKCFNDDISDAEGLSF